MRTGKLAAAAAMGLGILATALADEAHPRFLTRGILSGRSPAARAALIDRPDGTTPGAEAAVEKGLDWLAKAQEPDGSWSVESWGGAAGPETGVTGLALMAFLGAGYTHQKGKFKVTVARGLEWLKSRQKPDGSFVSRTFYEQGIATIAACEAAALTRDREATDLAQKALDLIWRTQPEHGGFRYMGATTEPDGDLSVSGWQMVAIASGICAELKVPQTATERSCVLLRNTYRGEGGSSYTVASQNPTPGCSAIGMLCRQLLGPDDVQTAEQIGAAAEYLLKHVQRTMQNAGEANRPVRNLYFTYYASLAMFQAGGDYWTKWTAFYRDQLVKQQVGNQVDGKGRLLAGSWDPADYAFARGAGRVYATAMAVLCLETPYRYMRLARKPPQKPADF